MPYGLQRNAAANILDANGAPKRNNFPYREPGSTVYIRLSKEAEKRGEERVKAFIKDWSLDCTTPRVDITQTTKGRGMGNRNTLKEYTRAWNECYLFFRSTWRLADCDTYE